MRKFEKSQSGRCFIIGNGPSLRIEDLEALNDEVTFASNRIYGVFSKTNWRPTYYVSQDQNVLNEIKDELYRISFECKQMILNGNIYRSYSRDLRKKENVSFLNVYNTIKGKTEFDIDVIDGIHYGINVTYTMIELALFMGFSEIYLIGVDNNYALKTNANGDTVVDNESPDSYFEGIAPLKHETIINDASGVPFDNTTLAYNNIKKYIDDKPQKIYNATRGGKLEVFERVDFDLIMK